MAATTDDADAADNDADVATAIEAGSTGPRRGEEFRVRTRGGLPADEVRSLSTLSWSRGAWAVAHNWGLIAIAAAVALRWPHPLIVAAAALAIAGGQHGLAVLAHEAAHYRLLPWRRLNDLAGTLCAAPLGISMLSYRLVHRIHHNHLYEPLDPDLPLIAGYPRGRGYLVKKLLKDLCGVTTIKNYLYFFGAPVGRSAAARERLDDTSPSLRAAARRERNLVLAANVVVIAAVIAVGGWRWYLLLWLLPLVTLLQVLLRLRAVLEHGAVRDTTTPFTAARTNLPPRALTWLLFPHSVHYHIEHHLYPSIPHYRLAECHRRLRARGLLDGAEVAPLGVALGRIFAPRAAT